MHFNEPEIRRLVLLMESLMSARALFKTLLKLADHIVSHCLGPSIADLARFR